MLSALYLHLKKFFHMAEWARKFKKVQAKKTLEIKEINFMKSFFDQNPFCGISNMAKFFFLKLIYFDFTSFLIWTFLIFLPIVSGMAP